MAGWCCAASSLCPLLRTWKFCVPQQTPEMLLLTDTPKAHEIFFTLLHKALQFRGQSVLSTTWVKKALLSLTGRAQHFLRHVLKCYLLRKLF